MTVADNAAPEPTRLLLSRRKGFDLQALSIATNGLPAVSCARPGSLGNPFPIDVYGQDGAVDRFRRLMHGRMSPLEMSQSSRADRWSGAPDRTIGLVTVREWICEELERRRGHNLACWCRPGKPCHVDVYLAMPRELTLSWLKPYSCVVPTQKPSAGACVSAPSIERGPGRAAGGDA